MKDSFSKQPNSTEDRRKNAMYRQLADDLRSALEQGHFGENEALPTEEELSRKYSVSRNTVRQAFHSLVAEGLVYRVPGRGTFPTNVAPRGHYLRSIGSLEDMMAWTGTEMEVIRPLEITTNAEIAGRMNLPTDQVATLVQRRWYENVPFGLINVYLPPELGQILMDSEALPAWGQVTVIDTLEQLQIKPVAGAEQAITAVPAPEQVAKLIGCQANEALLYVERTYLDNNNKPVELAVCHYNPERYVYNIRLRRSGQARRI